MDAQLDEAAGTCVASSAGAANMTAAAPLQRDHLKLEEGELIDSEGELEYTPLVRPENYKPYPNSPPSPMSMNVQDDHTDESEHEPSSDPDSDSDECNNRPKRRKLKFKRHRKSECSESTKNNKYNIWSKTFVEETLANDLFVCDVTKNNYLGIESYNYNYNNSTKRRFKDRHNPKLRIGRRNSCDSNNEKGNYRHIPDLTTNTDSPEADVAKDISSKLSEEKDKLILRIVECVGRQKAIELFTETKRIEEDGGMIIRNGMRRRTPGGVFIFLLKRDKDVTQDLIDKIFLEDKLESKRNKDNLNKRIQKVEELKQSLNDGALPTIRTRAEQWLASEVQPEDMNHVSNPPPSPATDGRDGSSDIDSSNFIDHSPRTLSAVICSHESSVLPKFDTSKIVQDPRAAINISYDDLDIGHNDDMDLF